MQNLYRFSPIQNETVFQEALVYITEQLEALSQKVLGEKLPITYLKVFPHYFEEYKYLYQAILAKGTKEDISSERNLYVRVNEEIKGHHIRYLGLRIVDPYRMQVGCGDWEVEDFEASKTRYHDSPFVRKTKDENMLEVWHPDFDVLGYIIPKEV